MFLAPLGIWDAETFPSARLIRNPEGNFDAFTFLTWLSQHTRKAKVGVAVTEAIRRHPAEIAQAALSMHHLSKGRFVLGIGAGEKENIEPYGLSFRGQVSRLEEALYVIRLLWGAKDYVSYEGKFFRLDRAIIGLGPYRGTLPPVLDRGARPADAPPGRPVRRRLDPDAPDGARGVLGASPRDPERRVRGRPVHGELHALVRDDRGHRRHARRGPPAA